MTMANKTFKLFRLSSYTDRSTKTDTTEQTLKEKSVSFASAVRMRKAMPLSMYTEEEIQAMWYTEEESEEIIQRCNKEIGKLDDGKRLKDVKYSARGLERYTRLGSVACSKNRSDALEAVLSLQHEQQQELRKVKNGGCKFEECYNTEMIAEVYRGISSSCQMWAHVLGLRDHNWVETFVEDDEDVERLCSTEEQRRQYFDLPDYTNSSGRASSCSASSTIAGYNELVNQTREGNDKNFDGNASIDNLCISNHIMKCNKKVKNRRHREPSTTTTTTTTTSITPTKTTQQGIYKSKVAVCA